MKERNYYINLLKLSSGNKNQKRGLVKLKNSQITKEQYDYLTSICNNIINLKPIDYDKIEEFSKIILPVFNKYSLTWTDTALMGFCLIDLALTKQETILKSDNNINNQILIDLVNNYKKLLFQQSIHIKGIMEVCDSSSLTRNKGFNITQSLTDISCSLMERFDVLEKYNFSCAYCGRSPPEVFLQLDHIIPKCKGGTNDIDNLAPSCWECNNGKRGRILKNGKV